MENYKKSKGRIIMKKYLYITLILFISGGLLYNSHHIYAGGLPEYDNPDQKSEGVDIAVLLDEIRQVQDKLSELDGLKDQVKVLQQKVISQDKIINDQKKVLEKISEVPMLKEKIPPVEQPKVLINKFIINNAQVLGPDDFAVVLSKYRGRELSISDLEKIADKITQLYRSKRYISSLAYVPPQEIKDNTAQITVVEGRIGDITIEGGKYYKQQNIERKFHLEPGQILNYAELDKNLRRINKQPDRTVEAVMKPGEEQGTSDIVLKTADERPWHISAGYSNEGTLYTTKNRYTFGLAHNNLLGHDDKLSGKFQMGDRSDIYSVGGSYTFPINKYDTRLGAYGAYSHSEIGGPFEVLSPGGKAVAYGGFITHPLFDEDMQNPIPFTFAMDIIAGFDSISVWNKLLGQESSHDELRVIKAGFNIDEKDSSGRTFISQDMRIGLKNFLGSMDKYAISSSRLDGSSEFVKNTGSLTRISRLPAQTFLVGNIKYQITSDPLVTSEQFVLGGSGSVRGYPENEYFADYGMIASAELRMPAFLFPRELKVPWDKDRTAISDAIQFVCFADMGKGYLKKARVGERKDAYLAAIGLGLRFDLYKDLKGKIDWGFPIKSEPSDGSSSTVHINIGYEW
jgi:hemolysin activation/secretion protein